MSYFSAREPRKGFPSETAPATLDEKENEAKATGSFSEDDDRVDDDDGCVGDGEGDASGEDDLLGRTIKGTTCDGANPSTLSASTLSPADGQAALRTQTLRSLLGQTVRDQIRTQLAGARSLAMRPPPARQSRPLRRRPNHLRLSRRAQP